MLSSLSIGPSCALAFPRPRSARRNHLRSKFLLPPLLRTPPPPDAPTTSSLLLPQLDEGLSSLDLLPTQHNGEETHSSTLSAAVGVPALPADRFDARRLLLELPLYFGGLLVVQTVCAVVLFGGSGAEKREVGVMDEGGREWGELEGKVLEIRAMAREARLMEAKEGEIEEVEEGLKGIRVGVREEVDRRVRRMMPKGRMHPRLLYDEGDIRKGDADGMGEKFGSVRKRLEFSRIRAAAARSGNAPKGFGIERSDGSARRNSSDGAVQQISKDSSLEQAKRLAVEALGAVQQISKDISLEQVKRTAVDHGHDTSGGLASLGLSSDSATLMPNDALGMIDALAPSKVEDESLESSSGASGTGVNELDLNVTRDVLPNASLYKEDYVRYSGKPVGIAMREMEQTVSKVPDSQGFDKKKITSKSALSGFVDRRSKKNIRKFKSKPTSRTGDNQKPESQYWWLKLPYVLAIWLHRGSNVGNQKGLYTLKIGHSSDSPSYTVLFQDRGDATNFCYLMESFFEDLGDVNVDILPLTTQEVEKAVKAKELNVVVVQKGQLNLYAGQPLVEVERALRSILHHNVLRKE